MSQIQGYLALSFISCYATENRDSTEPQNQQNQQSLAPVTVAQRQVPYQVKIMLIHYFIFPYLQYQYNLYQAIQLLMSALTSKFKSTPTFTFKGRNKSITSYNDSSFLPSPNQYNPEKVSLRKSPSAKFPKSIRKQWEEIKCRKNLPGPGTHQPISYTTTGQKRSISSILFKQNIIKTPSPGEYNGNPLSLKKRQPSFSMRVKTKSMHDIIAQKNLGKPGPTNYEQPIVKYRSSSSITMPKSLRKSPVAKQKNPGPGSYETEKSFNSSILSESKCKIGKQKRKIDFSLGQRSPGPGVYQNKSSFQINQSKQRGYTCRSKILAPINKYPGPGQYQTPIFNSHKSSPLIKMAKSIRVSFTDKSINYYKNNPGPGTFDVQGTQKVKYRSMSVHKFPKSNKNYLSQVLKNQSSIINGPGIHKTDNFYTKDMSPKYSIGKSPNRLLLKNIPQSPGPGQYNPKLSLIYESQNSFKIQKSQRLNFIKHLMEFPGPGEYQSQKDQRLGLNFKFSKQKRSNFVEAKIAKQNSIKHETYEQRQQFPNPPRYMNVVNKLKYNQNKLKKA